MTNSIYKNRRTKLINQIQEGIIVIPTSTEKYRNADNVYPFRADSNFFYFTGFTEPDAVLILITTPSLKQILFCQAQDDMHATWIGQRTGPKKALETGLFDEAYEINQLDQFLLSALKSHHTLWFPFNAEHYWKKRILSLHQQVWRTKTKAPPLPAQIRDISTQINQLRSIKDVHEISLIKKAADISVLAHKQAMKKAKPGLFEYQLEAELQHQFLYHGATHAYPPIVATGENACILHYTNNHTKLQQNDAILIDAGAEYQHYAADITRTFPVSGQFTGAFRDLYEIVLLSQQAAINASKQGAPFNAPHLAAISILTQGLIDLGIILASFNEAIDNHLYQPFFMHQTSHFLGLDVHDAGFYQETIEEKNNGSKWAALAKNNVITIEPGVYIRPHQKISPHFWNIGIRIEDDILITPKGPVVLTDDTPKLIQDIEELMKHD